MAAASKPAPASTVNRVRTPDQLTWAWLIDFLRRELAPYPGRASTVARITIAASLVMLIIMTFHIPGGALGGYYTLIVTRENLRSTLQQAIQNTLAFAAGTVYTLFGMLLFVDSPVTHFFWVIGSFYLIFFVMGTVRNYGMAAGFSFLIATAIPLWDRAGGVEAKIDGTLYTLLSVVIGLGSALLVEGVYRSFHPRDSVVTGLCERLHTVAETLRTYARGERLGPRANSKLLQYAMIGPASLRRSVIRAGQTAQTRAQIATLVSLTGRLVDLAANLEQTLIQPDGNRSPGSVQVSPDDASRLLALADAIGAEALSIGRLNEVEDARYLRTQPWQGPETLALNVPLLPILERTVTMLRSIFSPPAAEFIHLQQDRALLALLDKPNDSSLFLPDAFTNRDHLKFALRGCLAASLCYVIYNGIDWPGINTAVATCIITALGTIGSSRQKQVLRISGAIAGGFLISLPAQIYLLPLIDSITAFTLYFAAITAVAAWFATSSPRLSYFGLQIALAFYLINLQEFTVQTSLSVARDRVFGVLLGLIAMWVVFDQLWAPRAAVRMQTLLVRNLGYLAQSARLVGEFEGGSTTDQRTAMTDLRALRETINTTFSQMNEQADAVQFETGRRRGRNLRERERMQIMQPAMRTIFLLELALVQYRPGVAQHERRVSLVHFQEASARLLEAISERAGSEAQESVPATLLEDIRTALAQVEDQEEQRSPAVTLCQEIAKALEALWRAQGSAPADDPLPLGSAVISPYVPRGT
jgi:multidrug resistance protein MdtO